MPLFVRGDGDGEGSESPSSISTCRSAILPRMLQRRPAHVRVPALRRRVFHDTAPAPAPDSAESVRPPPGWTTSLGTVVMPFQEKPSWKDIGIPGFHPGDQNSAAVRSLCGSEAHNSPVRNPRTAPGSGKRDDFPVHILRSETGRYFRYETPAIPPSHPAGR